MFDIENTTIIAIDIQEKLVNMLSDKDFLVQNCNKILKAASILGVDTILTEQYPKGLGSTIDCIKEIKDFNTVEKTTFSALKTQDFESEFNKLNNKNVIVFGIETHICVLQSALDLLNKNYNVYILEDCCASRCEHQKDVSLELLKQSDCKIITLEIALFEFLKSSKHQNFSEIQALIK